jgi:hypothetical protein
MIRSAFIIAICLSLKVFSIKYQKGKPISNINFPFDGLLPSEETPGPGGYLPEPSSSILHSQGRKGA